MPSMSSAVEAVGVDPLDAGRHLLAANVTSWSRSTYATNGFRDSAAAALSDAVIEKPWRAFS